MVYKTMDIANIIIHLGKEYGSYLTNPRLQKVLYFLNASFLVEKGKPLLDELFSRWTYGPVIESVYSEFKTYGPNPIVEPNPIIKFNVKPFDYDIVQFDINNITISEADLGTIKTHFVELNKLNTFDLVNKTQEQDLWAKYKKNIITYSAPKYTNAEIKKYFIEHVSEQLWIK